MILQQCFFTRLNENPAAKREQRDLSTTVTMTDPQGVGHALSDCTCVYV